MPRSAQGNVSILYTSFPDHVHLLFSPDVAGPRLHHVKPRQANPVVLSIGAFLPTPGSLVMLEASLRKTHRPQAVDQVFNTEGVDTLLPMLLPFRTADPRTLAACISLAATIRKLLFEVPQPCTLGQQGMENLLSARDHNDQRLPIFMQRLQETITSLDTC